GRPAFHAAMVVMLGFAMVGVLTLGVQVAVRARDFRLEPKHWVALVWSVASIGNLLIEGGASRLALPTEDYARGPRRALLGTVIGSLVIGGSLAAREHTAGAVIALQALVVALIAFAGLWIATEPDGLPKHLRGSGRPGEALLRPGALRGYRLVAVLLA